MVQTLRMRTKRSEMQIVFKTFWLTQPTHVCDEIVKEGMGIHAPSR